MKLPRTITHDARLAGVSKLLSRFMEEVRAPGDRLGLLLATTAKPGMGDGGAGTFCKMLRRRHPGIVACEPRHVSWFAAEATAMLVHHGIASVAADPPPATQGDALGGPAEWQYWRLDGSPRIYYRDYDADALNDFKQRLNTPAATGER